MNYLPKVQASFVKYASLRSNRLLRLGRSVSVLSSCRFYSTADDNSNSNPEIAFPNLTDAPRLVWPSVINVIRNWIFVHFVIRPQFEKDFILDEFVKGSKKAVEVVSDIIFEQSLEKLVGLVTDDVIKQIQSSLSELSLSHRNQLRVISDDIYLSFPYEIGIIDTGDSNSKRFIEITMVYHTMKDFYSFKNKLADPNEDQDLAIKNSRKNIMICNYRFIKEFTKGVKRKIYGPLFHKITTRSLSIRGILIEDIDKDSFRGINNTLNELFLINTALTNFPKTAFQFLGNLSTLHISYHYIKDLQPDVVQNSLLIRTLIGFELSNGHLESLHPQALQPLSKLKFLNLHGNQLKSLQKNQFKGLRNLELLDLSHNYIEKIEAIHLTDLNRLLWINVSHNNLKEITRGSFAKISTLRLLKLSNNKIKKIDSNAFRGLRHLRRLYLSGNEIAEVGRNCFSAIPNIATISLNNNRLSKIDYQMFHELRSIETINLAENNITIIEKLSFKDLYLVNINLSRNSIEKIEVGAFENCNNITTLDLSHNQITEIPKKAFDEFSYAMEFLLSFNKLTNLNQIPLSNMSGIKILNASHNMINEIPKNAFPKLYELHTVDLSYNEIDDVFNAVFQPLLSLRHLNLSNNNLRKIKFSTFGTIFSLLQLNLNFNQITEVAESGFSNLASVRQLYVSHNLIDKIFKIPISLAELDLSDNSIDNVPTNLWPVMNSLLELDLSYNQISNNFQKDSFQYLLTLRILNLNANNISTIPSEALSVLPSLQTLYLEENALFELKRKAFGRLPVISQLHLSRNYLNTISEDAFDGLLQLIFLNMSHNNLSVIPNGAFHGLTSLKLLDLSFNSLEKINNKTHSLLEECLSLEKLNLSNNRFSSITRKTFPSNPYIPYRLIDIDFSHNSIYSLTYDIVIGTKKLEKLNLSYNGITEVQKNVIGNLTNLKVLDLSNNQLKEFASAAEVSKFPKSLTGLNLSKNKLTSLPWKSFLNLSLNNFEYLDVTSNKFEYVYPEVFYMITNSTEIILKENPLRCNCLLRPLKKYLSNLIIPPSIYQDLKCASPDFLNGVKLLEITDEDLLQCSKNSKYAYLNHEFDSDYKIRSLGIDKNGIKIRWLVNRNTDIADCYIIIRNQEKPLEIVFETIVPYVQRELTVGFRDISANSQSISNNIYEICLIAIDSKSNFQKLFEFEQCKVLSRSLISRSVTSFTFFTESYCTFQFLLFFVSFIINCN